jgi:mRNA-degrading endonuclease toxin of MazEF toxin-antitoxin module
MTRRVGFSAGMIVIVKVADPRGGNPKPRRVVVLADRVSPVGKSELVVVALTSTFDPKNPLVVQIPYGPPPRGHPATKCVKATAAVCNWVQPVSIDDVIEQKGYLSQDALSRILAGVRKCFPSLLDPMP